MTPQESLARACEAIRMESLPAYVRLLDAIEGLSVDCIVGKDRFRVLGSTDLTIGEIDDALPSALVVSSRAAILAVIDGEMSLLDAVKRGKLDIRADTQVLLRLARAQRAFAEGAARARRVEDVLAEYRSDASETA